MVHRREVMWVGLTQCAEMLNVSPATIRNWVRAGYLERNDQDMVSSQSIDFVKSEVIGRESSCAFK